MRLSAYRLTARDERALADDASARCGPAAPRGSNEILPVTLISMKYESRHCTYHRSEERWGRSSQPASWEARRAALFWDESSWVVTSSGGGQRLGGRQSSAPERTRVQRAAYLQYQAGATAPQTAVISPRDVGESAREVGSRKHPCTVRRAAYLNCLAGARQLFQRYIVVKTLQVRYPASPTL